jgi:hypothetical protein
MLTDSPPTNRNANPTACRPLEAAAALRSRLSGAYPIDLLPSIQQKALCIRLHMSRRSKAI